MTPDSTAGLVRLWAEGDSSAASLVMRRVYDDLRQIAAKRLRHERDGHTLTPTGLVHEVYLRAGRGSGLAGVQDRSQFLAWAATVMRHILVDHARNKQAQKRGGGDPALSLDDLIERESPELAGGNRRMDEDVLYILALNDALVRLAGVDPQSVRVIECRFFADMSVEETATALGISTATVKRDWAAARAWLLHQLEIPRHVSAAWFGALAGTA